VEPTALYLAGDPKGIAEYIELTLTAMQLGTDSPKARVAYSPQSRQLVVEYELPAVDVVPKAKSYRYVKSQDKVVETARPASQVKGLYAGAIARLTLACLARIFRVDTKRHIDVVVFNGVVETIDPRTGKPTRPCLITVRTTRDTFTEPLSPMISNYVK
jgi:restriction system protein